MRFLAAGQTARAKLGCKLTPGSTQYMRNIAIPAIPATHSILVEWFTKYRSYYTPITAASVWWNFLNSVPNQGIFCYRYWTPKKLQYEILGAGWDTVTNIPLPSNGTLYCGAFLFDRDNGLKRHFKNGDLERQDAITQDPNFNTANNLFYIEQRPGTSFVAMDYDSIVWRLTTLSSVPADIDAAIKRMYARPLELDASLAAVAVIASQWDLEDFLTSVGTNIDDHGIVGGFPLTASASVAGNISIVEQP